MTYYRFPENRVTKAVFAAFMVAMLYLARDSMFALSIIGFYQSQFLALGLMGALGLAFLIYQRKHWKQILLDRRMLAVLAASALILGPMALKRDWQFMYLSILLCIYCAVFLTYFISYGRAAKYYVVILTVLAVFSIFAAYFLRWLPDNGYVDMEYFRNGSGYRFYNFFLSVVPLNFVKTRNFGIFREPGVYQFFLILGLYLTQYEVQWKKPWHMWTVTAALSAAMLTTLATGGIFELAMLALYVFIDKKLYRNKVLVIIVVVVAILAAAVLMYCIEKQNALWLELYLMAVYKFTPQEASASERMDAVVTDLKCFLDHPLVGGRLAEVLHSAVNNTTSTLILYAVFGFFSGSLHVLAWAALVWKKERSVFGNLYLLAMFFLSFNTQNLTWDLFFWLFPVMALVERGLPMLPKGRRLK